MSILTPLPAKLIAPAPSIPKITAPLPAKLILSPSAQAAPSPPKIAPAPAAPPPSSLAKIYVSCQYTVDKLKNTIAIYQKQQKNIKYINLN